MYTWMAIQFVTKDGAKKTPLLCAGDPFSIVWAWKVMWYQNYIKDAGLQCCSARAGFCIWTSWSLRSFRVHRGFLSRIRANSAGVFTQVRLITAEKITSLKHLVFAIWEFFFRVSRGCPRGNVAGVTCFGEGAPKKETIKNYCMNSKLLWQRKLNSLMLLINTLFCLFHESISYFNCTNY